jgi:hypothetical protein
MFSRKKVLVGVDVEDTAFHGAGIILINAPAGFIKLDYAANLGERSRISTYFPLTITKS